MLSSPLPRLGQVYSSTAFYGEECVSPHRRSQQRPRQSAGAESQRRRSTPDRNYVQLHALSSILWVRLSRFITKTSPNRGNSRRVPAEPLSPAQATAHRRRFLWITQPSVSGPPRVAPFSALAPRPACGRGRRRFPPRGPPTCPPARCSRSRCASARGCNAPRTGPRSESRPPTRSACRAECTRP